MIPLFLPEQVQAMDARAFARGVDPARLMDTAAHHLARGVLHLARDRSLAVYGLRVVLLCGKGNNGGDGIAAACHLQARGAAPTVVLVTPAEDLGTDAARELAAWRARRGRVMAIADAGGSGVPPVLDSVFRHADVAVDCLLGTGSAGAPRGAYAAAVEALNRSSALVVACDLPSGLDGATGVAAGEVVRADLTVTLGAHKQGLWLADGPSAAGRVVLGELGVVDDEAHPVAQVLEAADLPVLVPPAGRDADKRDRGVLTIYAGSTGMTGAAVLVARGALAAGAGLVTVATAETAAAVVRAAVPEAMTVVLPEDADGIVEQVTDLMSRADVLAMGPGLGLAEATQQAVRRLIATIEAPVVLDADGLNAFRDHVGELPGHASRLLVMTPHAGELGRLAGVERDDVDARRAEVAADRAAAWSATVLAKGAGTVVADPDGRVWVTSTGGPALATGGTGDVLTGVTAALLAQQPDSATVAAAAHLHGLAGDLAGARLGARSTTALAFAEHLGAAARELGL
ncbi:NAD(P)H-hydrate dehydratase [soil metagenome]